MNGSQEGHRDDINDINIAYNSTQTGGMGIICIPQADGNAIVELLANSSSPTIERTLLRDRPQRSAWAYTNFYRDVHPLFLYMSQKSIELFIFTIIDSGG